MGISCKQAINLSILIPTCLLYYYPPLFDYLTIGDNVVDNTRGPERTGFFISKRSLSDIANITPPLSYTIASSIVVFITTSITRTFLYFGGKFRVEEDENYKGFVERVKQREAGIPLITVGEL